MWLPQTLLTLLSFFALTQSTIISDTGCSCALTKGTVSTPNASSTVAAGCSFKTDWTGQTTEWCLTDQTYQTCGTFQPGFGYVDSCSLATFSDVSVQPAPQIEWDQTPYTYYTGQTFNITWNSQNILQDEWARIQYVGAGGTRTLTTGSGVNITAKQYSVRLSDSTNGIATTPVPVSINLPSTASISVNSIQNITVLQSKIMNIALYNNNLSVASGATLLCDNGNLTVVWRGLGQAQIGAVNLVVKSTGGGTTVGTAINLAQAAGNMSVNYVLPRSFSPSGFANYAATVTVQEPGQTAYTLTSYTFKLSAAPSTSPTPTPTPTSSKTPTPSVSSTPSNTPTPSATPSTTPSPSATRTTTPTPTPTQTPSPSLSSTPAASLDLAALARNAANSVDTQTPAIAGALGGIGGILILLGGFKWYQQKVLTEKRKKKLAMSARWVQEANAVYGVHSSDDPHPVPVQPNIVMYTVQNMPPKKSTLTTKKAFTPVQGSSV